MLSETIDIEALVYRVANAKLGEGLSMRCEGPTDFEKDQARHWVRRVLAAMPASPSPPAGGGEPVAWRFLDNGEIIAAGDEAPSDDCSRWEPVNRWAVGCPRSSIFKIIRRRVSPSPDAAQQRIRELEDALRDARTALLCSKPIMAHYEEPQARHKAAIDAIDAAMVGSRTAGGSADE